MWYAPDGEKRGCRVMSSTTRHPLFFPLLCARERLSELMSEGQDQFNVCVQMLCKAPLNPLFEAEITGR